MYWNWPSYGKYLSVKVPGGKWYHELDKLDERFSEEKFRFYLDMPFTRPVFVVGNTVAIHKRGITDFQMKYYLESIRREWWSSVDLISIVHILRGNWSV